MKTTTLEGEVVKGMFGMESKSEHEAVYLVVDKDTRYKLQRKDGDNSFQDDELDKLVGKYISAEGIIYRYSFIMESYREKKQDL